MLFTRGFHIILQGRAAEKTDDLNMGGMNGVLS